MRAKKSLGQHFLMHPRIAERIVLVAGVGSDDTVLEVGPGGGILTEALLATGARVVAVEADANLLLGLEERFATAVRAGRFTLIHADIREYLAGAAPELPERYAVVANIPYYLTGELIRTLLTRARQPSSATLLVQKEVAERIARSEKGSLLALSVAAYGMPHYEFTVPRGAFVPAPTVDSAVLTVRDISRARFASPASEDRFFALIRAGFAHKRKYLRSNLVDAGLALDLSEGHIPEKARAEDLALDDWLALARGG